MAMASNQLSLSLLLFFLLILTVSSLRPSILLSNQPADRRPTRNIIILKSSDGVFFEVNRTVISISETIKHMTEESGTDDALQLPDFNARTLSKVIQYCHKHLEVNSQDIEKFDSEFMRVDHETLFGLIRAANYLKIQGLGNLTIQTVGKMIMGKTPAQIRQLFNITDDCKG